MERQTGSEEEEKESSFFFSASANESFASYKLSFLRDRGLVDSQHKEVVGMHFLP